MKLFGYEFRFLVNRVKESEVDKCLKSYYRANEVSKDWGADRLNKSLEIATALIKERHPNKLISLFWRIYNAVVYRKEYYLKWDEESRSFGYVKVFPLL